MGARLLKRECGRRREILACSSGSYYPSVPAAGLGRWRGVRVLGEAEEWPGGRAPRGGSSSPASDFSLDFCSQRSRPAPTANTHRSTLGWILVSNWGQDPGSGLEERQVWPWQGLECQKQAGLLCGLYLGKPRCPPRSELSLATLGMKGHPELGNGAQEGNSRGSREGTRDSVR